MALVVIGVVATVLVAMPHLSMVGKMRADEMPLPTGLGDERYDSLLPALRPMAGLWVLLPGNQVWGVMMLSTMTPSVSK